MPDRLHKFTRRLSLAPSGKNVTRKPIAYAVLECPRSNQRRWFIHVLDSANASPPETCPCGCGGQYEVLVILSDQQFARQLVDELENITRRPDTNDNPIGNESSREEST